MKLRIAGVNYESVVDGPGIRAVIFAQGCPHKCKGCHNPATHDTNKGELVDVAQLYQQVVKSPWLKGVTFSGGEPFLQAEGFAYLGKKLKSSGLNLVTYTGYTFEELLSLAADRPEVLELLQVTDLLIDGPFVEEAKDLSLAYRGSSNQRLIKVKESLAAGQVVQAVF